METELLIWTMIAIVGTIGVLKNFINVGGKRLWTLITLVVGVGIAIAAIYLPIKVIQVWVAVTGATLFYDTIFKAFQKMIELVVGKISSKE
ncbi:MAG: hypothetical protein J6S85_19725 [Methanobrevibacter sp.]|nr:hypothetical protein [Methanobrevibacter sp.]